MPNTNVTISTNVSVNSNESVFYVDFNNIHRYTSKINPEEHITGYTYKHLNDAEKDGYNFDLTLSQEIYNTFRKDLVDMLCKHYKSMSASDRWLGRYRHIIAESDLIYVAIEDNDWSLAVEILRPRTHSKKRQDQIMSGATRIIRDWLINRYNEVNIRTGNYSSEAIDKHDARLADKLRREIRRNTHSLTAMENPDMTDQTTSDK